MEAHDLNHWHGQGAMLQFVRKQFSCGGAWSHPDGLSMEPRPVNVAYCHVPDILIRHRLVASGAAFRLVGRPTRTYGGLPCALPLRWQRSRFFPLTPGTSDGFHFSLTRTPRNSHHCRCCLILTQCPRTAVRTACLAPSRRDRPIFVQ